MREQTRRTLGRGAAVALAVGALCGAGVVSAQSQEPSAQMTPEAAAAMAAAAQQNGAKGKDKKDDFPDYKDVVSEYEKVISTADGKSLYTLWRRDKDQQMLAELPREFERQRLFVAMTIAGGDPEAGVQWSDQYAYWKRFDKRLALIEPNVRVKTDGDPNEEASRKLLFTDRVIVDVPILTMSPQGGPVIDLDALLVGNSGKFYGDFLTRGANTNLATIAKAKAFPENIELAFEMPMRDGRLTTLHYSWSVLPENTGYKPRAADPRVGFFTTSQQSLGDPSDIEPWKRVVNRWKLEKADPSLKLSPPKQPIVWYIEHTTPVRYRRFVREGIEMWNEAFEEIGILNAIEVYQQDASTGAHMEKDPEDARYNFFRWNTNSVGYAIGPSRVDPRTGQILDADVVFHDGLLRAWTSDWMDTIAPLAVEGFAPETMQWLAENPEWDPRVMMQAPAKRPAKIAELAAERLRHEGICSHGGHSTVNACPDMIGDDEFDGLAGRVSQVNGMCKVGVYAGLNIALARIAGETLGLARLAPAADGENGSAEDEEEIDLLDNVSEEFLGGFIRYVSAHEVGHCIGLRHNFKSSTIYSLDEMNSGDFGDKAMFGSVMEYAAANINFDIGPEQGPYTTKRVGPYDRWAIAYGYGDEKNLKDVLSRVAEPELAFGTDEDSWGPDPRVRVWDMGKDPLQFAESRMKLVQDLRGKIVDKMVKDGDGWWKARRAYSVLLGEHIGALSIAARWVGGSYVNRDRKGDPGNRPPIENIPVETQRRAFKFVINNAFNDNAFGLTPELLSKMTVDKWWDEGGMSSISSDETWNVHDTVMGIQVSAMTMLLNPTTLRRVYDNEVRIAGTEDTITVPEVIYGVSDAIWTEIDSKPGKSFTARQPMVSSLRRNLQAAHLERMIDLTMPSRMLGAASRPVSNLAVYKLKEIKGKIDGLIGNGNGRLDPYTLAHLSEASTRIGKALEAEYIYNLNDIRVNVQMPGMPFGAQQAR